MGHATPLSLDLRRDLGIWTAIASVAHVVLGLQLHEGGRALGYFVDLETLAPRLDTFGLANGTGLAATGLVANTCGHLQRRRDQAPESTVVEAPAAAQVCGFRIRGRAFGPGRRARLPSDTVCGPADRERCGRDPGASRSLVRRAKRARPGACTIGTDQAARWGVPFGVSNDVNQYIRPVHDSRHGELGMEITAAALRLAPIASRSGLILHRVTPGRLSLLALVIAAAVPRALIESGPVLSPFRLATGRPACTFDGIGDH